MTEATPDVSSLQFRVEAFSEPHLPLVARFSERYWSRPRTTSYYKWRYLDSLPFSRMFIALTETECLGMVFALRKQYQIEGKPETCLEIFDWHTLPGLKGSGVGIRVMRAMMREGVRLIGIGGTPDAVRALPVMGWQQIGSATSFELPLHGEVLINGLRERTRIPIAGERLALHALTSIWFRPRRRRFDGRSMPVSIVGDELKPLYERQTSYDVLQVPDASLLRWMTAGYAGAGGFGFWYFWAEGVLCGWAMTRVYEGKDGREAAIVDAYAASPGVALLAWMISELTTALAGARPRVIRARASCPLLQAALRANRFRPGTPVPILTWPKMTTAEVRTHITLNHTDASLRPYTSAGIVSDNEAIS